jgi:RimJ/RimL family protein N-acetyltransferase
MPFAVPWTDRVDEPDFEEEFVRFHRETLDSWRPSDWQLLLAAFSDGKPVGVQGVSANRFAEERTVRTGSWLGRSAQGKGLGTEMRVAVLELAFRHLDAAVARSGAMAGNEASLAVSRRLGYQEAGMSTRSPRGEPVAHHDLELVRDAYRAPFDVTVEGADGLRSLFGAR